MGNICGPKDLNKANSLLGDDLGIEVVTDGSTNGNNTTTTIAKQNLNFDFSNPDGGAHKQVMIMNFLDPITGKYKRLMVRKLDNKNSID